MSVIAIFVLAPIYSYQNFDDHFCMNIGVGEHYEDVAWCKPCGSLGSTGEYWEQNAGCELNGDEVVIYYYNESALGDYENDVYQHVYFDLTTSYLYDKKYQDGKIIYFENQIDMRNLPKYLACVRHGNEVVCVGGQSLAKVGQYAQSITF